MTRLKKKIEYLEFGYRDLDTGIFYHKLMDWLQSEVLGFCICGNPILILSQVKEILEKFAICERENITERYEEDSLFILYWLESKKYIEHGCSILDPWLTEEGADLYNILEIALEKEGSR